MEDKYTFETNSPREMELVVNRDKLVSALDELQRWRRDLYKRYDNDIHHLCDGKLFNQHDMIFASENIPRDETGKMKESKEVYYVDTIINKVDDILYDIRDLID